MKTYWYPAEYNVGDTLTPHILAHFRPDLTIEPAKGSDAGKLLMVGSIMKKILPGDTVLGTGVMRATDRFPQAKDVRFLSVRGPLSRQLLKRDGAAVPEIYGDPALLLPRMYRPEIEKTYAVGYIPHYVDKQHVMQKYAFATGYNRFIDVALPWREFVDAVLSCERIISSSLHGIVIAEAYGIPAEWVEYSDKVIGKGFKFRDYLMGTLRSPQDPGAFPPIDPHDLEIIQERLIHAISTL